MALNRDALLRAWQQLELSCRGPLLGIGTGTTVEALCAVACQEDLFPDNKTVVASSIRTQKFLSTLEVDSVLMAHVSRLDLYIDGVDHIDHDWVCLKGGGGAMTGEKLCANMADNFVAIYAKEKEVTALAPSMPLPVEVVSWARSSLGREIIKMGGKPVLRDRESELNNPIVDCYGLSYAAARKLEEDIAKLCGVIGHGLFAERRPDRALVVDGAGFTSKNRL